MANGSYLLDRKVEQLREEADRVVVRFSDGSETAADLVIGADGIASVARATVDSQAAANVYAGYVGWRGLLPERDLPGFAASDLLERFAYFRMPHSHVLGFLVPGPNGETKPGDRRYNWVWYRPAIGPTARDDVLTDREGRIHPYSLPPGAISERARERLVDDAKRLLPRSFVAAVEATRQPFVQGIFDYETERMISQRIALVGDAAFVVRPHTGMGIAKAAADAMALRKHLASAPLGEALQQYGQERRQAGGAIAASGRELGAHLV